MKDGIVLLDGAIGTTLWDKAKDKVSVWRYNIEEPEIVLDVHREYIEAGSDIIFSNTFSANSPSVNTTAYSVEEIMMSAMDLAHEAVSGTKTKIALSVGPLTGLLKPYGTISNQECYDILDEQISAGVKGKPDLIVLETFMDIEMLRIGCKAARKHDVPLFCSMSFAKSSQAKGGRTLMGNSVDDIINGLAEYDVDAAGLNCSMGPETALNIIKEFSEKTDLPLMFKPNAGMPRLEGGSQYDYDVFAKDVAMAAKFPGVKYLGGCCGSNPKYIEALKLKLEKEE